MLQRAPAHCRLHAYLPDRPGPQRKPSHYPNTPWQWRFRRRYRVEELRPALEPIRPWPRHSPNTRTCPGTASEQTAHRPLPAQAMEQPAACPAPPRHQGQMSRRSPGKKPRRLFCAPRPPVFRPGGCDPPAAAIASRAVAPRRKVTLARPRHKARNIHPHFCAGHYYH